MQTSEKRAITWEMGFKNGLVIPLNHSGQAVTPETAMSIAAVNAAVRLISTSIASLPLVTYRKRADGGRDRATGEPIYTLLHDQPNPAMTPAVFWELAVSTVLLRGNFYAEIERAGDGTPLALWPLPSESVQPELDRASGQIVYAVRGEHGQSSTLAAADIVHVLGYSEDGVEGCSVLKHARESFGLTRAMEVGASATFKNMCRPGGTLTYPGEVTPEMAENLKRSITGDYAGAEKTGSVIVLEEGATFEPLEVSASDLQWNEGRAFQLQEVARFFQISPTKLGDLGRATWSNLESESLSFVQTTLRPWLIKIESELNRKLGLLGTDLYCEFLVDAFMRGSTAERYGCYSTGIGSGWLTIEEVRERENMPALAEPVAEIDPEQPEQQPGEQPEDVNPDVAEAAAETPIADTAMNGAQVASMMEIVGMVARKEIPVETAIGMIKAAFPALPDATIASIIDPLRAFTPAAPDAAAPQPPTPESNGKTIQ